MNLKSIITKPIKAAWNFAMEHGFGGSTHMEKRQHVNADSTIAYVSVNAHVDPAAYIHPSAMVLDGARVKAGEHINAGDMVTETGIINFGKSAPARP